MAYADGSLIKSNDAPEVWLVQGGQRHLIPNPDVFNADGFSWAAILIVSDADIAAIPQGDDVPLYTTWLTPGPDDPVIPGLQEFPTVDYNGVPYKRWMSGGGGRLIWARGEFVVQTGQVRGGTVTQNDVEWDGYHSGTSVIITDSDDVIRWTSPVFRVGVNPKGTGPTVFVPAAWNFQVPQPIADSAAGFTLSLSDAPDSMQQMLNNSLGALINTLVPAINAIGTLFGGSKRSTGQAAAPHTTTDPAAIRAGWSEQSSNATSPEAAESSGAKV